MAREPKEDKVADERPLIDSGQLRQAITFVVRKRRLPTLDLPKAKAAAAKIPRDKNARPK